MLLGRVIVSGIGLLVSAVFIVASATMNYAYLSSQAEAPEHARIFGWVAVGVTLYNAVAFFFIRWGWENAKRKLFVPACATLQAVFLFFSLMCALGFASSNRGAVTGSKEALAARFISAQADLKATEQKLNAFPGNPSRAASVIAERLSELRQDRRWLSSRQCEDATAPASIDYCRGYFQLRQELKGAVELRRLEDLRAQYDAEVLRLRAAGADREADPQGSFIVRLLRGLVDIKDVQMWWVAIVALVVEMGASLGPYLATGHGFGGRRAVEWRDVQSRPLRRLEQGADGTWQVVN